jgi:hypothetical protein
MTHPNSVYKWLSFSGFPAQLRSFASFRVFQIYSRADLHRHRANNAHIRFNSAPFARASRFQVYHFSPACNLTRQRGKGIRLLAGEK